MKRLTKEKAELLAQQFRATIGVSMKEPISVKTVLSQLENQMIYMKNIKEVKFGQTHEERKEYARLTSQLGLGRGESASMVYCRFHDNVLGSSNLRDIIDYCDEYGIKYLTTIDFLYYAIKRGIITKEEADEFVIKVRSKNSRLPNVDFSTYICTNVAIC